MYSVVTILPKGEGFSDRSFGAIALCVRDFTRASRYRNSTLVIGGVKDEAFEGTRFLALPRAHWWENRTRSYARQAADVIRRENAALAEIHNRPHILNLIAPRVDCALALHLHNDPHEMEDTRTASERRKLLARCSAVYCVSKYIRDRFLEGLEEDAGAKVHVVYNGIAIPPALPAKQKLIAFAGRMTEGKGALILAQGLAKALSGLPDWRAVLIGSGRHAVSDKRTPYEQHVAETLAPLGAQAELAGFLSHAQTLGHFARAAIVVIPSLWQEPFGRTALEAMVYGSAVISSGRGGLHEVTGDTALTLDDFTADTLAGAILTLAANEGERKRLGRAAYARGEQFSIARCTKTLDDIRDRILTAGNRHVA